MAGLNKLQMQVFGRIDTNAPSIYSDAIAVFSLRKVFHWTNAVLKVRRNSDNATKFVFFDDEGKISLSSYVSDSNSSQTEINFGSWVGENSAFVEEWLSMKSDNIIGATPSQTINSLQPRIVDSGVLETKNGEAAINFLNTPGVGLIYGSVIFDINRTVLTVSATNGGAYNFIFGTWHNGLERFMLCNSRDNGRHFMFTNSDKLLLTTANTNNNQRLLTALVTSDQYKGWRNNISQGVLNRTGTFNNGDFNIGIQFSGNSFTYNGTIQEIVVFPTDKTADLTTLHGDINSYYSIY